MYPFEELPNHFPKWLHHLHSPQYLSLSVFFDSRHPSVYEALPHYGLGLHFLRMEVVDLSYLLLPMCWFVCLAEATACESCQASI